MKSREQLTCTNCKERLNDKKQVFQGVIICDNCYKLVSHAIKRTQGELKMLFLVYTDMIRVGLLKGEFRPPVISALAMRGGENEENGNSSVLEVPSDKDGSHGKIRVR